MPTRGLEPEKRLYPSQQRRLIARTLGAMGDKLPRFLVHAGIHTIGDDLVETALAHYRGADRRYRMDTFATDLVSWKPVVDAFSRIIRNS